MGDSLERCPSLAVRQHTPPSHQHWFHSRFQRHILAQRCQHPVLVHYMHRVRPNQAHSWRVTSPKSLVTWSIWYNYQLYCAVLFVPHYPFPILSAHYSGCANWHELGKLNVWIYDHLFDNLLCRVWKEIVHAASLSRKEGHLISGIWEIWGP